MFLPHQYLASIDDVVIGKVDVIKGLVVTNPHPVDNNILKELRLALKRVFHLHSKQNKKEQYKCSKSADSRRKTRVVSHELDTQVVAQFLGNVQWRLRVRVLVTHRIRLDAQHELQTLDTIQASAHVQNVVAIVVASRQ